MRYLLAVAALFVTTLLNAAPPMLEPVDANIVNTPGVSVVNSIEFSNLSSKFETSIGPPGTTASSTFSHTKIDIHAVTLNVSAKGGECFVRLKIETFDGGGVTSSKGLMNVGVFDGGHAGNSYPLHAPIRIETDTTANENIRLTTERFDFSGNPTSCLSSATVLYEALE